MHRLQSSSGGRAGGAVGGRMLPGDVCNCMQVMPVRACAQAGSVCVGGGQWATSLQRHQRWGHESCCASLALVAARGGVQEV